MLEIPTLRQIYEKLGCQEKTAGGVCWFECNTSANKAVILFHGVTGGKIDMVPLAERYVNFGYAVYAIGLPGHSGSRAVPLNSYDDLANWFTNALAYIGRTPDVIISNSYASSITYHALRTGKVPQNTKIIMACPTPRMTLIADTMQILSNLLLNAIFGWAIYNSRPIQIFRTNVLIKSCNHEAYRWLLESESYKKATVALQDSEVLTSLLYRQNPFVSGVPRADQQRVTVILGGKDNVANPKTNDIMRQLMPEAQFINLPAAGHILQFEAVDSYPDV